MSAKSKEEYQEQITQLEERLFVEKARLATMSKALGNVLVKVGVTTEEMSLTGPQLLMAAITYLEQVHSLFASDNTSGGTSVGESVGISFHLKNKRAQRTLGVLGELVKGKRVKIPGSPGYLVMNDNMELGFAWTDPVTGDRGVMNGSFTLHDVHILLNVDHPNCQAEE